VNLLAKTVLVTRQSEQAAEFVDELARIGARALVVPMIRVIEPDSWEECDRAIARIGFYNGLVFASANGVKAFFRRAAEKGVDPQSVRSLGIYAVGRKTQETIEEQGYTVRFIPDNFSAESLVAGLEAWDVSGKRFLFPRGNLGRDELISGLKDRGAVVDVVEVYKNIAP